MSDTSLSSPIHMKAELERGSTEPATPPAKKRKTSAKKATGTAQPKAASASPDNGSLTSDTKAALIERIITNGFKNTDIDALASELGLSRQQITNQFRPGRRNLREKAIKAVRGE